MRKYVLFVVFALSSFVALQAQDFNQAIGLRFGYPTSVTYKKFVSDNAALEGIAGFRRWSSRSWFNVGGAYQIHNDIDGVDGLQWYYGGGASAYFWSFDNVVDRDNNPNISLGIQGYLGLSYTFEDFPLNLSVDWVPSFFLSGFDDGFSGGYGGLSARYILD